MVQTKSTEEDEAKGNTHDRHHEHNRKFKLCHNLRLKLKYHKSNYAKHEAKDRRTSHHRLSTMSEDGHKLGRGECSGKYGTRAEDAKTGAAIF